MGDSSGGEACYNNVISKNIVYVGNHGLNS